MTNSNCLVSAMMKWNCLASHFVASEWLVVVAHRTNHRNDWHVVIVGSMVWANQQSPESMMVLANRMCLNGCRTFAIDFGMDCFGVLAFAAINHTSKRRHIFAVWWPIAEKIERKINYYTLFWMKKNLIKKITQYSCPMYRRDFALSKQLNLINLKNAPNKKLLNSFQF